MQVARTGSTKRRSLLTSGALVLGIFAGVTIPGLVQGEGGDPGVASGGSDFSDYDPFPGTSKWGPDDQAGATNTQTPEKVLEAKKLIRTGQVFSLGHDYDAAMPVFPAELVGAEPYHGWDLQAKEPSIIVNQFATLDIFCGEIGQLGTQIDALAHFAYLPPGSTDPNEALFYNSFTGADLGVTHGGPLNKLGMEQMKPIFTRGVLFDIVRHANGGEMMQAGQEITLDMVLQTKAAQGTKPLREGDVALFYTGWENLWYDDPESYYGNFEAPGIGFEVAKWLADQGVACVGADNWGVEVAPNPDPPIEHGIPFPVHHHLIVKHGIPMQESMRLGELAEYLDTATPPGHEFAYIYVPVPITGATGGPGIPIAVR